MILSKKNKYTLNDVNEFILSSILDEVSVKYAIRVVLRSAKFHDSTCCTSIYRLARKLV